MADRDRRTGTIPIEETRQAAEAFVQGLDAKDQVAVFSFNEKVDLKQDFTTDKNASINAIRYLLAENAWTALYDAEFEAIKRTALRFPKGSRAVVIFTDGQDQGPKGALSLQTLASVIDLAKEYKVPVYTIGLGNAVNYQELGRLSDGTGGQSHGAATPTELTSSSSESAAS